MHFNRRQELNRTKYFPIFMKAIPAILLILGTTFLSHADSDNISGPRKRLSMDLNWSFTLGDPVGAQNPAFDDQSWRSLDVPHDWSIEGPYAETNTTAGAGGFLPAGIGWYRKHFVTPATFRDKAVSVQFDGVYMNTDVYLNGHQVGHHAYGYTSFICDLTPFLAAVGKSNVLAVRVDNATQPNSRWYTGAGIYRHVWANVVGPVHVATWGTYITTPKVSTNTAEIIIKTLVQNNTRTAAKISVHQEFLDPTGKSVGHIEATVKVPAKGEKNVEQTISVRQPQLWSINSPTLYTVRTSLSQNQVGGALEIIDSFTTSIGIRQIEFDHDRGFLLNGQHIKLLGMCVHHDGGAVGAAVPVEVWERRLKRLKGMGCNAIRSSHNPPAPEFLDLCDRLGLLVMDEAFDEWTVAKGQLHGSYASLFDKWSRQDLLSMLRHDRNHPSIIMWSIGNEIPQQSTKRGVEIARTLADICHAEDPSRPVTAACDMVHEPRHPTSQDFLETLDIAGYNYVDRWGKYRELMYSPDREKYPKRKFLGSEDTCVKGTRGDYFTNNAARFPYVNELLHAEHIWKFNAVHDYVIGYFMWTGVDYLGEARAWPRKAATSGVLDTCGFPKDGYYFYQSQWTSEPMVHVFPHWNYPGKKGDIVPVVVFSNCREVELQLNGKSYGVKSSVFPQPGAFHQYDDVLPIGTTKDLHLTWDVPFEPGVLRIIGRQNGQIVAQEEIRTAGTPATIALKLDKTTLESATRGVAQIEVRVLDANGIQVPNASNTITFDVEGPANIIGVDNGDPISHDSYKATHRPVFNGMALITLQAAKTPGHVTLIAKADGLQSATVKLEVQSRASIPTLP